MRRLVLAALPLLALAACTTATPRNAVRAVVFFNEDSAALDENAQELLTQIAEQAKERPTAVVRVRASPRRMPAARATTATWPSCGRAMSPIIWPRRVSSGRGSGSNRAAPCPSRCIRSSPGGWRSSSPSSCGGLTRRGGPALRDPLHAMKGRWRNIG
ncbi:hypothetical protein ACFQU2_08780 [Siccirubricoccus deserti]